MDTQKKDPCRKNTERRIRISTVFGLNVRVFSEEECDSFQQSMVAKKAAYTGTHHIATNLLCHQWEVNARWRLIR